MTVGPSIEAKMLPWPMISKVLVAVTVAVLLAGAAALQRPDPPKKPEQVTKEKEVEGTRTAGAGVLPSAALRLGADLEGAAPAVVVKWARKFAKREIIDRPTPATDEAVAQAVRDAYPQAPAASRQAGEILVWYLAYQQSAKAQEIAGQRVRELEREIGFLQDDLRRMRNTPVPIPQMGAAREAEDRVVARQEQAERQRDMHKRVLDGIITRVDVCLERLAALSTTIKDRDPAAIRGLK